MRPISDQPELGMLVKLFLKNGKEAVGHCTLIHSNGFSCLYWYVKKRNIGVDKIKGWMPITQQ